MRRSDLYFFSFLLLVLLVTCSLFYYKIDVTSPEKLSFSKSVPIPKIEQIEDEFYITNQHQTQTIVSFDAEKWQLYENQKLIWSPSSEHFNALHYWASYKWKAPNNKHLNTSYIYCYTVDKERKYRSEIVVMPKPQNIHLPQFHVFIKNEDLVSFDKGIYTLGREAFRNNHYKKWYDAPANYHMRGKGWVKDAKMLFGTTKFLHDTPTEITLQLNGNATRSYPQKSIRIKPKSTKYLKCDLLPDTIGKHKSLILRNGGNNWGKSMINDAFIHELALTENKHCNYGQYYKPIVLYINGEYWGIHNLRNKIDDNYLAEIHHVKPKDITLIEGAIDVKSKKKFNQLENIIDEICKLKNPDSIYIELKSNFNYDNLLHYFAIQCYVANTDWPKNNTKCFQINSNTSELNNKWNWILWDLDYSYGYQGAESVNLNMFNHIISSNSTISKLFRACLKSDAFVNDFILEYEYLFTKSYLNKNVQLQKLNDFKLELSSEIDNHIKRWRHPVSRNQWNYEFELIEKFILYRENVVRSQLQILKHGRAL